MTPPVTLSQAKSPDPNDSESSDSLTSHGRGLSQQPNFQGNLVNIDNQYQGGQCVYVLTDLESSDRGRSVS